MPWRGLSRLLLLGVLILAANWLAESAIEWLDMEVRPSNEDMVHRMIMFTAALYAGLIAIPFVPGVEVGLALIGMLGKQIAPLVYVCTLIGLTLSFLVGRLLPLAGLIWMMDALRFRRGAVLLRRVEPLSREERIAFLLERAPTRAIPFLLRHRYIALAVAVNLPGNFLIGGGGGIALVAGISRFFSFPGFLLTIALAVAPVPFAIFFFGTGFLGK